MLVSTVWGLEFFSHRIYISTFLLCCWFSFVSFFIYIYSFVGLVMMDCFVFDEQAVLE